MKETHNSIDFSLFAVNNLEPVSPKDNIMSDKSGR